MVAQEDFSLKKYGAQAGLLGNGLGKCLLRQ
jgi:hypothetical protein